MTKKATIPLHIKNSLRGATAPHATLSALRGQVSPKLYPALLAFLPTILRNGRGSLNPPFPASYRSLVVRQRALAPLSLDRELLWSSYQIAQHSGKIDSFIKLKHTFESTMIAGDANSAEEILDSIEQNYGVSFFLIETRLALLQQTRGLEQQKAYLASIRKDCARGITPFIAFWLSQKNELTTNPLSFPKRFVSVLRKIALPEGLIEYIQFRVLGQLAEENRLSEMLRWSYNSSLIDQYETLVAAMQAVVRSPDAVGGALAPLIPGIRDQRLEKLSVLLEGPLTPRLLFDEGQLQSQAEIEAGDPDKALRRLLLDSADVLNPLRVSLEAIARCDLASAPPTPAARATRGQLVYLLYRVFLKDDNYEESLYDLIRLIECFPALSFGPTLRPALEDAISDNPVVSRATLIGAFVSSPFSDPASLLILPPSAQTEFATLLSRNGYDLAEGVVSAENRTGRTLDGLPSASKPQTYFAEIHKATIERRFEEVLLLSGDMPNRISRRNQRRVLRSKINSLLKLGQIEAALEEIAAAYLSDPHALHMLAVTRCVEAISDDDAQALSKNVSLAIVYDLYLRFFGDDRPFIRNDSFEDCLSHYGYKKPSQMGVRPEGISSDKLLYFLRYVCIPEVMLNSGSFISSKEVDDERLKVCALLREIDPENASDYDTEVREITRKQIIQQGLRHVEQSKLAIDPQPIRRWADKNLKEDFIRYQALRSAGIKAESTLVSSANNDGSLDFPVLPSDEIADLVSTMVSLFLLESYTNSFYGLDSYLSMRARHGSFAGQIRAPLEEENVITVRDGLSDDYKPNITWLSRIRVGEDETEHVDKVLRLFAREFDAAVKDFADRKLQIRGTDKPEGLFSYKLEALDLYIMSVEVKPDDSFDRFVDQCFIVFWQNVESCLETVRSEIDSDLKVNLNLTINNLVASLEGLKSRATYMGDLISAVLSAQTRLQQAVEGLKEWFHTPKPVSPRIFSVDEIIDISLQQVKRLHPDFDPQVRKQVPIDFAVLELTRFSDVFFIVFENIQRHAGVGPSPVVEITVNDEDGLQIEVLSEMVADDRTEAKLQHLRQVIAAGQYQKIVKSEGGTGLVKLWNVINTKGSTLEFGIVDGKFRVFARFPISWLDTARSSE